MNQATENMEANTDQATQVEAAPQPTITQSFKFHFREDKLGNKRKSVELSYAIMTAFGVAQALASGDQKVAELIVDAVNDSIHTQAREQVNNNVNIDQSSLDTNKLALVAIANLPKAERRGGGISKEVWEAFGQDYLAVMLAATGKEKEKIEKHVAIFLSKFQTVKSNKPVIEFMRGALAMWMTNTKQAEEYQACFDFLDNKADALLKADEAAVLENL